MFHHICRYRSLCAFVLIEPMTSFLSWTRRDSAAAMATGMISRAEAATCPLMAEELSAARRQAGAQSDVVLEVALLAARGKPHCSESRDARRIPFRQFRRCSHSGAITAIDWER